MKYLFWICLIFSYSLSFAQNYRVLESTESYLRIEFDFSNYQIKDTTIDGKLFTKIAGDNLPLRQQGEPWLPIKVVNIGLPQNANPIVTIETKPSEFYENKFVLPIPKEDNKLEASKAMFNETIYSDNINFPLKPANLEKPFKFRFLTISSLVLSPFQFNPAARKLTYYKKLVVRIDYKANKLGGTSYSINDKISYEYASNSLINSNVAKNWVFKEKVAAKELNSLSTGWYNPNNKYYKVYLKKEGIYRVTYQELAAAGFGSNITCPEIAMYYLGNQIPLRVVDSDSNNIFNSGDYIEFVGENLPPSPHTYLNIYNNENVVWLTTQKDSTNLRYQNITGRSQLYEKDVNTAKDILHIEKDTLYERLGHAVDDNRDYWFMGGASAYGSQRISYEVHFDQPANIILDSTFSLRVDMHGLTTNGYCSVIPEHKAYIKYNQRLLGYTEWSRQTIQQFEKNYLKTDSNRIFPSGNIVDISVTGENCHPDGNNSDEIRINWVEIEYWKHLRSLDSNHVFFKTYKNDFGIYRFWTWLWRDSLVQVFIPGSNKLITEAKFDTTYNNSFIFIDTVKGEQKYYCKAPGYYSRVDSIVTNINSDLHNTSNRADYLIITHQRFKTAAEQLKAFRESHPLGSITNPSVKIAYVDDIYNEFSNGLLDPFALKDFVQYVYDYWAGNAVSYVTILGDMSWDYRNLLPSSRPNFVPSLPYHCIDYGQAVSDNNIVCVSGYDNVPDISIGRISVETQAEANIVLNKIINYPANNEKPWKQNVILVSSGLSEEDELYMQFNAESMVLDNNILAPKGISSTKIMRYPDRPEYMQYKGSGQELKNAINNGGVMLNYYGHGGGYQWDFLFLNDDILQLQNPTKLPVITSITCYTAHFDNQDIFGEQFLKAQDKGCIGFFGSTGLTGWAQGPAINKEIYREVFTNGNHIIGDGILKAEVNTGSIFQNQMAVLVYLGEPGMKMAIPEKADFKIIPSNISFSKQKILKNDSVFIAANIQNLGVIFKDTVLVEALISSNDTSYALAPVKLRPFGEFDSCKFYWKPTDGGLYTVQIKVNANNKIPEDDHSDNIATTDVNIYDISSPVVIDPVNGYTSGQNKFSYVFSDMGYYADINLSYEIEIDTTTDFANPLVKSGSIAPKDGMLNWTSPVLPKGQYWWHARIFDGNSYGFWSEPRLVSYSDSTFFGFNAEGRALKTFENNNFYYDYNSQKIFLQTKIQPPLPNADHFKYFMKRDSMTAVIDTTNLTTITTDGKYIYTADNWYYANNLYNPDGKSKIYKIGTGKNGTVEGKFYGEIPDFYDRVSFQICYGPDGYLYSTTTDPHKLWKINVNDGSKDTVHIPDGLLNWDDGTVKNGAFYITADSATIYNVSFLDSVGNPVYKVRFFDPITWQRKRPDLKLFGFSYGNTQSGIFVTGGYLYTAEYYLGCLLKRYDINTGIFDRDILSLSPKPYFYSWCYDRWNDRVYASTFRSNFGNTFGIYEGTYINTAGDVTTPEVGPVYKWGTVSYNQTLTPSATKKNILFGYNNSTRAWDTLKVNIPNYYNIDTLNNLKYSKLKMKFIVSDSIESGLVNTFNSYKVSYKGFPELMLNKKNYTITPDTVMQGFDIEYSLNLLNIGHSKADSVNLKFLLGRDSLFNQTSSSVSADSSASFKYKFNTASFPPATEYTLHANVSSNIQEVASFNNFIDKKFYIARDSSKPNFKITVDGAEILNGDVISANPEIVMSLKDNSPLPLKPEYFTLVLNNIPVDIVDNADTSVHKPKFYYTPYPNSEAKIVWKPELQDGNYLLEVLAKDASGNFFDSVSSKTAFSVFNKFDVVNVLNYPNPFKDDTHFTFELHGDDKKLDDCRIKIFTVAGRLIRDINIPVSSLKSGFNKIYWDGRDQDGDNIANGVYFYKLNIKSEGKTKSITQKLAKVK